MINGKGDRQIIINDRKPDYEIDEASGRLFNLDEGQLLAYNITEAVPQQPDSGENKQDKK